MTLPGFELLEHPRARIWTKADAVPWVRWALESGLTLYQAAAQDRRASALEGRQPVFVVPAKSRAEATSHQPDRWAIRHFARGGRVFWVLGDRYFRWGPNRPVHEAKASEAARDRGIPTPEVLAAAFYPSGPFYRADLVTEFVPGAIDLVEALFETRKMGVGGAVERQDALRTAGELIRFMARVGVRHRDIHAGNILLEWEGAAPRPHLLDLDRCEIAQAGTCFSPDSMLSRLQRSLRRWEKRTGLNLSEQEWSVLESAAMG